MLPLFYNPTDSECPNVSLRNTDSKNEADSSKKDLDFGMVSSSEELLENATNEVKQG